MHRAKPTAATVVKKILVVDDEPLMVVALQKLLTALGHQFEVADDPRVALERFEPGKYDLVITDYDLPRMDGLALARKLRQRSPQQRIILVSGMVEAIAREAEERSAVDLILAKPFSKPHLQEALAKVLNDSDS